MAYHQGNQRPQQGTYQQYRPSPNLYDQHAAQSNFNAAIPASSAPNTSSNDVQSRVNANMAYYSRNSEGIQHYPGETSAPPQGAPYPPRTTSYGSTATQGHYQPQVQAHPPPLYNPQQYGAPQSDPRTQYSPQSHSTYPNTTANSYQSYNPAAYHAPASNQSSYNVPATSNYAPPPLPPQRSYEQVHGNRVSPGSATSMQFPSQSPTLPYRNQPPQSFGSSQRTSTDYPYTPPAPPPPPFTPARNVFPSHTPSSSSSSQHHVTHTSMYENTQGSTSSPMTTQRPTPPLQPYPSPHTQSPTFSRRPLPTNNSLPPTPETPGPTPPAHSPHRADTTARHPNARPLPGPPADDSDYFQRRGDRSGGDDVQTGYDDLMQEVEAAVMGRPPPSSSIRRNEREQRPLPVPNEEKASTYQAYRYDQGRPVANGNPSKQAEASQSGPVSYDSDSDAEAEAGLAAMRSADEQDAADAARRQSGAPSTHRSRSSVNAHESPASSESGIGVDMSSYGGGFSAPYHYGDGNRQADYSDGRGEYFAATRASQRSGASGSSMDFAGGMYDYRPSLEQPQPFAPARVDTGGTGGLSEPSARPRRLSFEDGDESTLADTDRSFPSTATSPSKEGPPEMFLYPSSAGSRPLPIAPVDQTVPQLMPANTYRDPEKPTHYDEYGRPRFPLSPDGYAQATTPLGTPVPRSSSLMSHSSQPQTVQPIRSKTDADRNKLARPQQPGFRSASTYSVDALGEAAAVNAGSDLLDLPAIPTSKRRKFNPAKLSTNDFIRCSEPWALSSMLEWLKEMTDGEADLRENSLVDGIVVLFTHKVPTMNTADAEALGAKVVRAMFEAEALVKDEEWVKFGSASISGVLFQLTGVGCYSPRVHSEALPGRCYSHHCMRTLKKINLQTQSLGPQRKAEDWKTFYNLETKDIANFDSKQVQLQNILHEIVTSEDAYMESIDVTRLLYREELAKWNPPIIAPAKRDRFLADVFGNIDAIKQANEDFLLPQLKYRQQEQGPWITGFSDIFREWIRKARTPYVDYAAGVPNAVFLVRQESLRNLLFRQFLDQMQSHERSKRLDWQNYIKAPITRLQRYGLLLETVHKHMKEESEEKLNLALAIAEVKNVAGECNSRVGEMEKRVAMSDLALKLKLRPGMEHVQLNLTHLGREMIFESDMLRLGSTKMSWVDSHSILFDHYFVLAKVVEDRHPAGGEPTQRYDVSKLPIPMDLLVLESTNDDPVSKSTMKGLGGVGNKANVQPEARASRQSMPNGTSGASLNHVDTNASTASGRTLTSTTTIDASKEDKLLYPFRIRHLGMSESYVIYCASKTTRRDWCTKIIEAKTRHAASLYRQNAEPFKLRVIADTAFAFDTMTPSGAGIVIRGTPLDRAIRDLEKAFEGTSRPTPVCRAAVHCAAAFTHPNGTKMLAVGTDFGVFLTDNANPRGWSRSIQSSRVTQIAVLEEFALFLLISEKTLIAHHLDTVLHPSTASSANNTSASYTMRAPQKLSGSRDVGFFAHGRMKDRELIFYKKRDGVSSVFKILEPIYQRNGSISSSSSTNSMRHRLMGKMKVSASTEAFRDFDDFYIGSETYAINLFHSSLAISTVRGIEVMTLDKKVPLSVPDLKPPDVANIASRIRDMKPLGMFRVSDSEFLLAYEEVGVYVNKHGDVSRSVIMEYIGRAKQACLVGSMYLILVDTNGLYVEVRNAINGRLRQVISGKDVKMLDDGTSGGPVAAGGKGHSPGTVKICMQHPEYERNQIVVEMLVNEGSKE